MITNGKIKIPGAVAESLVLLLTLCISAVFLGDLSSLIE